MTDDGAEPEKQADVTDVHSRNAGRNRRDRRAFYREYPPEYARCHRPAGHSAVHLAGNGIGLVVILRPVQASHDVLHIFARDLKQRRLIFIRLRL